MFLQVSSSKYINVDIIAEVEEDENNFFYIITKSGKRFNYEWISAELVLVLKNQTVK